MRSVIGVLLVMMAAPPAFAQEGPLAIVGATLVDGVNAPVPDGVIVVQHGRIIAVGPEDKVAIPSDARRIEASGDFVMPGLIDAHVHFFQSGGLYTRPDVIDLRDSHPYDAETAATREELPATLARFLGSGITGVLDLGGPLWTFDLRDSAKGGAVAPHVAAAGPLLATYAPPELAGEDPPMVAIASPEEGRAEVRRLLPFHPDIIKVWFVRPAADIEPDMAWVRAVIAEAHGAGVRVAAHATQLRVAAAMVDAGIDVLAHSVEDAAIPDAMLRTMAAKGIVYIPTLSVTEGYRRVLGRRVRLTSAEQAWGDPAIIGSWHALDTLPGYQPPEYLVHVMPEVSPVMADNLRRAVAAGVIVAAGSDSGNIGTLPGPGLHTEMEWMMLAGLTPAEVIRAATIGGATAMGQAAETGGLAIGKRADLLLLSADPTADIRNSGKILTIVRDGLVFDPATIAADLPTDPEAPDQP